LHGHNRIPVLIECAYNSLMSKSKKNQPTGDTVGVNRKARHEYQLEDKFEAGLCLLGWEVKSLRAGRLNLTESYIMLKAGEAYLFGCNISPLPTASTHISPDPTRTRKLLLHRQQLARLVGAVERKGYTVVPLRLYFTRGKAKLEIALAKGKQLHDKRASDKERDWQRDKQRVLKTNSQ